MGIEVSLTAEQEAFAQSCVTSGRYGSLGDVMRSAVDALRRQEAARAEFERSLEEAVAEGERDGFVSSETVLAEGLAIIAAAQARQA